MADKKITALTELAATGKNSAADFLHIIDFSASPVNKKITVASLFSNVNTNTHIYGASKTLEVGFAAAVNAHLTVTTGANNSAQGVVTVNDDGVAHVDFLVKSDASASAIKVDAGLNTVTINGDSANCDFIVNGDAVAKMIFCDASSDVVGIGVATPSTNFLLDVAAVGGKSIQTAGSIETTGSITATAALTVGGIITQTGTPVATVGHASNGSAVVIPIDTAISYLTANGTMFFSLAAGAQGQFKTLICNAGTGTPLARIKGAAASNVNFGTANGTVAGTANTHLSLEYEEAVLLQFLNTGWTVVGMGPTAAIGAI